MGVDDESALIVGSALRAPVNSTVTNVAQSSASSQKVCCMGGRALAICVHTP